MSRQSGVLRRLIKVSAVALGAGLVVTACSPVKLGSAAIDSEPDVTAVLEELIDRFGEPPEPVLNLLEVARLRTAARRAGLTDITMAGQHIRFAPVELPDSRQVRVQRLYPKTVLKSAVHAMLVPVPRDTAVGGKPLRDRELLAWCGEVIRSVLADR